MLPLRIETNLNILRSAAVLSVLACHLIPAFYPHRVVFGINAWSIGRAGVLIFFVHTALVLMMSLQRMRGGRLALKFYVRRVFRIYPLSILVCVAISLAAIPRDWTGAVFEWSWPLFASNIFLVQNLTGHQYLTNPLWSLPYEVQMYLVLPSLFLLLRVNWPLRLGLAFAAGAAAAFTYRPLFEFVPCFLFGVLTFKLPARPRLPWQLWPCVIVLALLAYNGYQTEVDSLGKEWALCAVIALAIPLFADCAYPPVRATAELVARYSYGIYLWHFPLMWVFYRRLASSLPLGWRTVWFLLSVCACSILSYHWVEAPLIKTGARAAGWLWPAPSRQVSGSPSGMQRA